MGDQSSRTMYVVQFNILNDYNDELVSCRSKNKYSVNNFFWYTYHTLRLHV